MPRYKLTLEYNGGGFVGWQRQDNGPGVQHLLEDAVYGFCGERVQVYGAGRTDAGVHARGQVAHVDLTRNWPARTVRDALNAHCRPHAVSVLHVDRVTDDFHARFSATRRLYEYRVLNRRPPPALERGQVWWVPTPLHVERMAEAAQVLVGHHDFTTFRASECQARSPVKTLDGFTVEGHGDSIIFTTWARSFLHHQVRNMVGTLRLVGTGKWTARDVEAALAARDRRKGGPTAPADGLYLLRVFYDDAEEENQATRISR